MTRAIAGIIMGLAIAAILYLATLRTERHPMLIDAAQRMAEPQMLLSPCPLTPQNLPRRKDTQA